ncbi:hypothetical protein M2390_001058 [Mycetocola sp. BIGb0189]|uniref:hypothetical protein n=1 Tax=Mycetocola sp. BIGb0189 TaxID=2940604 RepID=UPI002167A1A1|nr:hypothetical protein [Mycetocola sp. BIGb0189]MCS4275886.1 hypothetical protein [Mycetocola sp. BIGb0189]
MMNRIGKLVTTVAVSAALIVGGGIAANAQGNSTDFGGILNKYQQSRYFVTQSKSSNENSSINFSGIGANYSANVKAEDVNSGNQFEEKKGLGTGVNHEIPNGTPAGGRTRLILTNNVWAVVDVAISGSFTTK